MSELIKTNQSVENTPIEQDLKDLIKKGILNL